MEVRMTKVPPSLIPKHLPPPLSKGAKEKNNQVIPPRQKSGQKAVKEAKEVKPKKDMFFLTNLCLHLRDFCTLFSLIKV